MGTLLELHTSAQVCRYLLTTRVQAVIMSADAARRRLMKDFTALQTDPPEGVTGAPDEDDIFRWSCVIFGPDDTPWEGGVFNLKLVFTNEYPHTAPKVQFTTKMFHPNIYADGSICLDILQQKWSPSYGICAILTSIQSLLNDPNPQSPANSEAARLYVENKKEYAARVHAVVEASLEEFDDEDDEEEDEEEAAAPAEANASVSAP